MSRKDVEETIIRPMRRVYLPPRHLRYVDSEDPDAREEAIEQYRQALEGYDRATLQRAWAKVRREHEYSIWPTPAALVQAAELCLPRPRPPSEREQDRQRALARAEEYADNFMKRRQVAKLAREEGWAHRLRGYVNAAAWVQAQLIEKLEDAGIGLPGELMRAGGFHSTQEAFTHLREAFAGAVAKRQIDVRVPQALIVAWKEEAHQQQEGRGTDAEWVALTERLRQRFQQRGGGRG